MSPNLSRCDNCPHRRHVGWCHERPHGDPCSCNVVAPEDRAEVSEARFDDPDKGLDAIYAERNRLVAALAHLFENAAWRGLDPGAPDFTVVYIDLPTGQVSWHVPDAEMAQFPPLPLRDPTGWDGHDTDEKYRRVAALRRGDICRDVAEAVQMAVNHERAARLTPDPSGITEPGSATRTPTEEER